MIIFFGFMIMIVINDIKALQNDKNKVTIILYTLMVIIVTGIGIIYLLDPNQNSIITNLYKLLGLKY